MAFAIVAVRHLEAANPLTWLRRLAAHMVMAVPLRLHVMELTVQTFLTLDGVMRKPRGSEEDPSDAFAHGGWQAPFPDPAIGEFVTELNRHASAFVFGRRTFDIFRGYWPDQTDPANPIATAINSLPKYVVSNSLSEAEVTWRGEHPDTARLVAGDVVQGCGAGAEGPTRR